MGKESLPAAASAGSADIERLVESDPSLVPSGPSALLVEPSVLDPEEVRALLTDLNALLTGAMLPAAPRRESRPS